MRTARGPSRICIALLPCLLLLRSALHPARAGDWLPVTPEELSMTAEPKAPGAPAIFLYREVDHNDVTYRENVYVRIKILTQEGLKQANVEVPYLKDYEDVRDVQARTIRPDGSIVAFDGKLYEQPFYASRTANVWMKTFTLPAVEVGSIIEYHFQHVLRYGGVYLQSQWLLNADLFTRFARFSLEPSRFLSVRWSWPLGLPEGSQQPRMDHGSIRLEVHDVPAFLREPYMPPEAMLRLRVDFVYMNNPHLDRDPAVFWAKVARGTSAAMERFLGKPDSMTNVLAQIVQPGDSPEQKLQKIYARTQQIENLSYVRMRTQQEVARENPKDIRQAGDVWSRGYGNRLQIAMLFLGLARAAGIEAYPVAVSTRNIYFFDQRLMNVGQLTSTMVLAKLPGKELYLAPGVPFTPFGLLPWEETGVQGLVLDSDGGHWVNTPFPPASVSTVERKATLHVDDAGSLRGKVVVTYTGLEALSRRLRERNEDAPARTQFLEDDLKRAVPVDSEVTLTNEPDWRSSDLKLVAEYDLKVPGWVSSGGRYHLLSAGLFAAEEKHKFEASERTYPVYFEFAFDHHDDVAIELPTGWGMASTLEPRRTERGAFAFTVAVDSAHGMLHVERDLRQSSMMVQFDRYDTLRDFYQTVRTGDEEQIVLSAETAAATH